MDHPCFGVLILNYNGRRWLAGLYDSLREDGYENKRVYLVDNGSSDGSQELTQEHYPEVAILQMPKNMGYSMAYNLATDAAFDQGCDWVVWQNNDTLVLPGWLERMAEAAASDPRIGVMGPVFRGWQSDGPNDFMQRRHADVVPFMEDVTHAPVDFDWVEGSAFAVKRACKEAVGPLDPALFMYWEEVDFCRRALRKNWRVVVVPGSVVRHFGGGTSRNVRFNTLKTRNEYVHTLCDPNGSFVGNAFRATRTFLVHLKSAQRSKERMSRSWEFAKVFLGVVSGVPQWHAKWMRDRRGEHPPALQEGWEFRLASMDQPESGAFRASGPSAVDRPIRGNVVTTSPRLSVVVPVRNRADLLTQTLDALATQDLPAECFEVVVCDDGSTDDLTAVVNRFRSGPMVVRWERQSPTGPAAARNLGVRRSKAPIIVFMDSDVVPRPSLLRLLLSALDEHPEWCGAEAALHPTGDGHGILWDAPISLDGGHYHTAAIAYRRNVLAAVGGLDEEFQLPACEDVELAVRILEQGPIGFVREAIVEHPQRRISLQTHWRWRRHWRYETILAVRYGILGFPGVPASALPRLRVAMAAVVSLPAGRFLAACRATFAGSPDGVAGMLYAMFDVFCGIWALPTILFAPVPARRDYLSSDAQNQK